MRFETTPESTAQLDYDPKSSKCPHCGTGDWRIHSFLCWNHPTPYIYGVDLTPIARKDGKALEAHGRTR